MGQDDRVRGQIVDLLQGGNAHLPFAEAVAEFPPTLINTRPPRVDYTFWHLLEHLRITQRDILEYLTDPAYTELEWPRDYWPAPDAEATPDDWNASIAAFEEDLAAIVAIVSDEAHRLADARPEQPGAHTPARSADRRRSQRLSHRRTGHPAPGLRRLGTQPPNVRRAGEAFAVTDRSISPALPPLLSSGAQSAACSPPSPNLERESIPHHK